MKKIKIKNIKFQNQVLHDSKFSNEKSEKFVVSVWTRIFSSPKNDVEKADF